ncbi:hypothetical protein MNV49_007178 [Pseudohyphozyma bogoriensis]|nr:hypothetical protein MNV49_007178 [Pseudohyphozyma bogoriensis]
MSVCQVSTTGTQVLTVLSTNVATAVVTTTGAPSTIVTSTPVLVTSCPAATACPGNSTSCAQQACSTSTSYEPVTSTIPVTDGAGQVKTSTSLVAIPTLLNNANAGSKKASTGAIAGGVVGGVVALIAAIAILFLMKKRGLLSRGRDEHFTEDMWKPSPHSAGVIVGGGAVVDDDDDYDENGNRLSGSREGSGGMMSEKGGPGSVGHQSWYGSGDGGQHRRYSSHGSESAYGGIYQNRQSLQSDFADTQAYLSTAAGRRLSHHKSMQSYRSHSSQGHEGPTSQQTSPASYHAPLPDVRQNHHQYYQQAGAGSYDYGGQQEMEARREELVSRSSSNASMRSAATTGSTAGGASASASHHLRMTPARPGPQVITNAEQPTSDSSGSAAHSSLFSGVTHSTSVSSIASHPKIVNEPVQSLKRPPHNRTWSDDSLIQPSQFLGARIANADTPTPEKSSLSRTVATDDA